MKADWRQPGSFLKGRLLSTIMSSAMLRLNKGGRGVRSPLDGLGGEGVREPAAEYRIAA